METVLKGRAAEAAVLGAFARRKHTVLIPFGDGQPYDLAIDLGQEILRVQCKTARPCPGGLMFNVRATDHGRGSGSYLGLADVFGVYFARNEQVYVVPVADVSNLSCGKAILRLDPARNNQRARSRLAADYLLENWPDVDLIRVAGHSHHTQAPVAS